MAQPPEFIAGLTGLNALEQADQLKEILMGQLTIVLPVQCSWIESAVSGAHHRWGRENEIKECPERCAVVFARKQRKIL